MGTMTLMFHSVPEYVKRLKAHKPD